MVDDYMLESDDSSCDFPVDSDSDEELAACVLAVSHLTSMQDQARAQNISRFAALMRARLEMHLIAELPVPRSVRHEYTGNLLEAVNRQWLDSTQEDAMY
eukprot:jgi/Ulvmu1/11417/UM075_0079.1